MKKSNLAKRFISFLVCFSMLISCLPITFSVSATENSNSNRVVDANTMDNWTKYFDVNNLDTSNAGGVWTDKSVFTNASAFNGKISMLDDSKNFLTALSAISANKEVVGYSTVPTDTVIILDLSNSMSTTAVTQLVQATNDAIETLYKTNKNNRVGVVLYSGTSADRTYDNSVARLMPIGRYTSDSNGNFISYSQNTVSVVNAVKSAHPSVTFESKAHGGATYIQAGLWEAWKMFDAVEDITVNTNNWQSGEHRMPIVVLMSDGAPTLGTTYFDDVENSHYGNSNSNKTKADVGDGNDTNITAGQGFLVQLTASYIKNRIENKYQVKSENGAGRSLFYTLGFNISAQAGGTTQTSGNIAYSVLNPDSSAITDSLWNTYTNLTTGSMNVLVKNRNGNQSNVSISKNSYAASKSYVDKYFSASGGGLTDAFTDIVAEIILQSRYYPTHLEGGNPDFAGYVEFTDRLGDFMEVKDIKGILLGDTLFDGHMMAQKLADNSESGLGTVENPTSLGDEFIRAVKTRLGIADNNEATELVTKAFEDGQLGYNGENDWSNYIAWYAKADGTYAGFYDEDGTEPVPSGAVYINRSYGFLGKTTGSIKNSDMMYMSVQVHENIETGSQTVIWKVPASLVPMITYLVSLEGANVSTAENVSISLENADNISPIRLIYETGLRSDLNEFNITNINYPQHVASDRHTRIFWNNYFDISAESHDQHITAKSEFTPGKENERFYYTFDSAVFKKSGENYVLVSEDETLNTNGEYYHRRYIFKQSESKPIFFYEKMSAASVNAAVWSSSHETLTGDFGAWVVPKGTPARELQMYDEKKAENKTNSANMVFHPYLTEHNGIVYVDMNLGNNGLLSVIPATGLKLSKTVDVFEPGTSDTFKFRITLTKNGTFDSYITALNETPSGEPIKATFINGIYEFELKKDQTFWLVGLDGNTHYTIEEIPGNSDYKIKSVHINGIPFDNSADGFIAKYVIDNVEFVNTAIGEGDLVITKKVIDNNAHPADINDSIKFTAELTLTSDSGAPLNGTFSTSNGNTTINNGKLLIELSEGESFVIRGIPEKTHYSVKEITIPDGFTFNESLSSLSGIIDATANDEALIVNNYEPVETDGQGINVEVTKNISGNRTNWLPGEEYSFVLKRNDGSIVETKTICESDAEKKAEFSLSGEKYAAAGTYYYTLTEISGTQGGVIYDTAQRRFYVVVADSNADGKLEIVSVNNAQNTTIEGNWSITAVFNNIYSPMGSATTIIDIEKQMVGNHPLNGYQFILYGEDPTLNEDADEVIRSMITDSHGKTSIALNYSSYDIGQTFTYYLAEVNRGETINNIKYSETVYEITVSIIDNLDGTISAETVISGLAEGTTNPVFINEYVPSSSDFITVTGTKEIIGNRALNANEFEFVLEAVTENAPLPNVTSVKNAANGSFVFPAIEFKDAHKGNVYQYKVTESSVNEIGGFTYDDTVYIVTVTVSDNGDQTITATVTVNDGENHVEDIVFENIYDAADARVTLDGTKLLTGKELQADEFEFELNAVTSGAPVPTNAIATNDEKGNINFEEITFAKAGTYVYEVTEINNGITNYDFDESVYTVTVIVTDNSQGVLSAEVKLSKNNMPATEIVFSNGFVPTPISYDIYEDFGGKKELKGRRLEEGEFEFALENAVNGQQIGETVKNDADGNFKFPAVLLNVDGIHHFKIYEVIGDEDHITYDTTTYHIRLEVVQDEDGVLSIADKQLCKVIVSSGDHSPTIEGVTFVNIYTEPTPAPEPEPEIPTPEPEPEPQPQPDPKPENPQTSDNQNLTLWIALLFVSGGGILATTIYGKKEPKQNSLKV